MSSFYNYGPINYLIIECTRILYNTIILAPLAVVSVSDIDSNNSVQTSVRRAMVRDQVFMYLPYLIKATFIYMNTNGKHISYVLYTKTNTNSFFGLHHVVAY